MNASFTVLLVDDDEDECLIIKRVVQESWANCQLICARSREEMYTYLNGPGPRPVLILMDANIPPHSGYEFIRELRAEKRFRSIPILVLTGSSMLDQVDAYYAVGANAYLLKPVSFQEYKYLLSQVRSFWLDVAVQPHWQNNTL